VSVAASCSSHPEPCRLQWAAVTRGSHVMDHPGQLVWRWHASAHPQAIPPPAEPIGSARWMFRLEFGARGRYGLVAMWDCQAGHAPPNELREMCAGLGPAQAPSHHDRVHFAAGGAGAKVRFWVMNGRWGTLGVMAAKHGADRADSAVGSACSCHYGYLAHVNGCGRW
jgi:hypothetical protein